MSSHLLCAWLDLARAALPAFDQFGTGLAPAQARWAESIKSSLQLRSDMDEFAKSASFALLQAQLAMHGNAAPAQAAQQLFGLQIDTLSALLAQTKGQMEKAALRRTAFLADLRQAESQDDLPFLVAGLVRDADSAMRKSADEAALLLSSAQAASDLLVHQLLDALIAPAVAAAPQPTQP